MRQLLLAIIALAATAAHADKIVCISAARTNALIYDAAAMTIDFPILDGINISAPNPMRITGAIRDRAGSSPQEIIFTYPMADGREVEITWLGQEQEIMRGLRSLPISAEIKRGGSVVGNYPNCRWQ